MWTMTATEYDQMREADIRKIRMVVAIYGRFEITDDQASRIWRRHSNKYYVDWLPLPGEEVLWDSIKDLIEEYKPHLK